MPDSFTVSNDGLSFNGTGTALNAESLQIIISARARDNPTARGQILINLKLEQGAAFDSFLSTYV